MSKTAGVYLLLGPERGSKENFITQVREQITGEAGGPPEIHTLFPFDTPINDVISLLKNGALFSPHKLVILHSAETIKKEEETALLREYCKNPSKEATLLILSDGMKIDKKIENAVPPANRKKFWEMFENRKTGWVTSFFRNNEITIRPEAVELLLDMVENNTKDLKTECERLAGFLGENATITEEDIDRYIYHSKDENIFTLFGAVAERDFPHTLDILQKILLSGEATPVGILGGLLWQFKNLLRYHQLLKNNYSSQEAFPLLNIKGKRVQQTYHTGYKNFSHEKLEQIIMLIAKYDMYVRQLPADSHGLLLSVFLYYAVKREQAAYRAFLPQTYTE